MFDKFWFCRGKFGEVKKCKEKKTGRFLAAKFIAVNGLQERDDVINEVDIMKTLQHPRLLQLYDAFEKKDTFCIVTELWVIWTLKKSFFFTSFLVNFHSLDTTQCNSCQLRTLFILSNIASQTSITSIGIFHDVLTQFTALAHYGKYARKAIAVHFE